MRAALLALALGACGSASATDGAPQAIVDPAAGHNFAPIAGQDEAVAIVWYQVMKMTTPPPRIEWIPAEKLDCNFHQAYINAHGQCIRGEAFTSGFYVQVSAVAGKPLSYGALAHELNHMRRFIDYKDADSKHVSDDWGGFFEIGGIVYDANNELVKAGL